MTNKFALLTQTLPSDSPAYHTALHILTYLALEKRKHRIDNTFAFEPAPLPKWVAKKRKVRFSITQYLP